MNKGCFKKGMIPWSKGKKLSKKIKLKMSNARKGHHWNKGAHWKLSDETKKRMSKGKEGCKCYSWKGGITPVNAKIRNGINSKLWRSTVFQMERIKI